MGICLGVLAGCGDSTKEDSDPWAKYASDTKTSITVINSAAYPAIVVANAHDEYDGLKNVYTLHLTALSKGKKYKLFQINGVFFKGNDRVGEALTGWKLDGKGTPVELSMNAFIPGSAPDRVVLTIDKDMTE